MPLEKPPSMTDKFASLRDRIQVARDRVAGAEENLKYAKALLQQLEQNEAVELLRDFGRETYTYEDGATLKVEQKVYASITEEGKTEALAWLKKNGHGAMIKSRCFVEFGRSEAHLANVLQAFCDRMIPEREVTVMYGNSPGEVVTAINTFVEATFPKHKLEIEDTVHSSTLKAFVTKQMKAGITLPEQFKVFAPQVATLMLPGKPADF
jgi:hypothetical protein